tara:strand:+ start:3730 stop:4908 length:1179 start_codon:yes stop_codon:yes gene_type:complete
MKIDMKKQIVFIEYSPTIPTYKIARTLKLTGRYETVLVSFRKRDKEFLEKAYDKVLIFELKHKLNIKNALSLPKKILSKEFKNFLKQVKKLDPYLFQISGPDLFTLILFNMIKKDVPKVYFAYDIWRFFSKKFALENSVLEIKQFFQGRIEKSFFDKADGILHKGPKEELKYLPYKIKVPDISFYPGCLDEWIFPPKKKNPSKELTLAYAGGPLAYWKGRKSFFNIMKIITSQKLNLYTTSSCIDEKDNKRYLKETKRNRYYNFLEKGHIKEFVKRLVKYDYGIFPDFYDETILNPLWSKTTMANKLFSYIEAGLPIIINKDLGIMSKIVREEDIGVLIDYNDLKNLKQILEKIDYTNLKKNVRKAQEKFRLSNNIKKLEKFYKEIADKKNN